MSRASKVLVLRVGIGLSLENEGFCEGLNQEGSGHKKVVPA
jgi:hypothetical protein